MSVKMYAKHWRRYGSSVCLSHQEVKTVIGPLRVCSGTFSRTDHLFRPSQVGEQILIERWDGEAPLIELIGEILTEEEAFIGEERGRILKHIGYSDAV